MLQTNGINFFFLFFIKIPRKKDFAEAMKHLQVLHVKSWRKRLLQLVSLLGVTDDEGVQVPGASDLELDVRLGLHDLDRPGVLSARREEKRRRPHPELRHHIHVESGRLPL